ncbi:class I adenylate-forming enzyme family protein [Acrocarpospora macrocephala]|uniref:class I adenylate-forming enzyme family protein n=1 Tax=Acrocarpospora macrocephala TaxID=150177 RepID=UPI0014785F42|nr:class I adenylate-forming enzyme family protein [Acrocarpospora macrocephala]
MTLQQIHVDPDLTFPVFLRAITEQHGDRTALVFGDESWTYRRLYEEVTKFEAALIGLGAGKGTRVALLMGGRPEWVVACFATMSIGAVCIPLSTYEPAVKRHQLLRHADASILILQDRLLRHAYLDDLVEAFPGLAGSEPFYDPRLPYLRHVVHVGDGAVGGQVIGWDDLLARAPGLSPEYLRALEDEIHPTDDSLVIYTSGTSGPSKGVIHTHRSVRVQFDRLPDMFSLRPDDVIWGTYPLFWSAGVAWVLGSAIASGATLVMQEWFDPAEAVRLIEKCGITVIHVTPPQLTQIEEVLDENPADLSSLRIFPRAALAGYTDLPPDRPFGGASLGLTEALTLAAAIPWDSPVELRTSTHGRPLPGMRFKIVDQETGEELPPNTFGEIVFKGTGLMRGYHKVFPEDYLDAEGFYHTNDGGYLDEDGYLHWTGRMSAIIRTNAANVSPGEVESALYENPDVRITSVIGVPDAAVGEAIVAVVVPRDGASLTEDGVKAYLKDRLASYKIPRQIFFVEESDLQMTATSKPVLSHVKALVDARLSGSKVGY